mgnify:CR=1 FL=1
MDPLTVAMIAQGLRTGAQMYGQHRQGQAQKKLDEETEAAQRRADAIAALRRRQAQRIPRRQAAMPKDARAASIMSQLAGLGSQLYGMKAGAGGSAGAGNVASTQVQPKVGYQPPLF